MKILIQDINFSYGSHDVLQGVNMEISPGQVVCIAGPNGSGKSTLLKCLARVLIPKSGVVYLDGREISRLGSRELARLAGYVPQNGGEIFPFTVLEIVLMGRKPHLTWGVTRHDLEVVANVLKFMGIGEMAQRSLAELSGGQKQKVFIARALAQEPQVFLLDEPTSSLDIKHQLEVLEVVKALARRQSYVVIMVLHDLNLAARFSDHIVMLKDGRIYAAGKPRAVVTRENIGAVYGVEALIMESSFGPYVIPVGPVQGSDICLQAAAF
ncbi:Ferric enterobactin transport ATP-binding protein FepC [Neomoorella glycerini]|uniref:Ferric enterobactin transport ATP-binding protein FepC n=1 Tax=Neomoorella glycerini TaxID=55779 RepID=A0A6I5ZV51_9FIRM|nr:ABC transporter ATP-binding protein [Moorella glycerini]QGP93860.1 Ferric enterobactin transport ATP-binding protein FepC [Moorella glycerini]